MVGSADVPWQNSTEAGHLAARPGFILPPGPGCRYAVLVSENQLTEKTFRFEQLRAVMAGFLETAASTFLLLITVREFNSGPMAKALVASGGSLGLLLTPWVVELVGHLGWRASTAAARLSMLGTASFLVMAAFPTASVFVVGSVLALAAASAAVPLMTQIYQENYPSHSRGRLFSRTIMIRIAAAAIFSELAGRFLSVDLHRFPWLLVVFAAAFWGSSWCQANCPSRALVLDSAPHPFRTWKSVRHDRLFCYTLICWMLMGFANLMMYPLRVEYLANAKYGLALQVGTIALLTGVIPNIARLAMSPIWGWLFDHMNFFLLRVVLNLGFGLGILSFFFSDSMPGLILGAVVFGISNAGGDVAWSLWVTKLAPPDRVADYMAVHTFFTGLRGVVAPWLAFHLLGPMSITTLGWISAGLILLASIMLLPEVKLDKIVRPLIEPERNP